MTWVGGCTWDGTAWQPVRLYDGTDWHEGTCPPGPTTIGFGDTIPSEPSPIGFSKYVDITEKSRPRSTDGVGEWNAYCLEVVPMDNGLAIASWIQRGGYHLFNYTQLIPSTYQIRLIDNNGPVPVVIDSYEKVFEDQVALMYEAYGWDSYSSSLRMPSGDAVLMANTGVWYHIGDYSGYPQTMMGAPSLDSGTVIYPTTATKADFNVQIFARVGVTNGQLDVKWVNTLGQPLNPTIYGTNQLLNTAIYWSTDLNTVIAFSNSLIAKFDMTDGTYSSSESIFSTMSSFSGFSCEQFHVDGNYWIAVGQRNWEFGPAHHYTGGYLKGTITPFTCAGLFDLPDIHSNMKYVVGSNYPPRKPGYDKDGNRLFVGWGVTHPVEDTFADLFIRFLRIGVDPANGNLLFHNVVGSTLGWYNDNAGHERNSLWRTRQAYNQPNDNPDNIAMVALPSGNISLATFGYRMWNFEDGKDYAGNKDAVLFLHDIPSADQNGPINLSVPEYSAIGNKTKWQDEVFWQNAFGWDADEFAIHADFVGGKYLLVFSHSGGENWRTAGEYGLAMTSVDMTLSSTKRGTSEAFTSSSVTWAPHGAPTLSSAGDNYLKTGVTATIWSEKLDATTWDTRGILGTFEPMDIPPGATITAMKVRIGTKKTMVSAYRHPIDWQCGIGLDTGSPVLFGTHLSPVLNELYNVSSTYKNFSAVDFNSLPTRDQLVSGLVQVGFKGSQNNTVGVQTKVDIANAKLIVDWTL